eukprot:tig00020927_g15977.t1
MTREQKAGRAIIPQVYPSSVAPPERAMSMLKGVLTGLLRMADYPRSGRGVRTSKRGPVGFYKGKGARNIGFHTRKGGYIVQDWKIPEIVVPDLSNFELKPYVYEEYETDDHETIESLQKRGKVKSSGSR